MKIHELKMAKSDYTIKELCNIFKLNPSTYYEQIMEKPIGEEKKKILTILKQRSEERRVGKEC